MHLLWKGAIAAGVFGLSASAGYFSAGADPAPRPVPPPPPHRTIAVAPVIVRLDLPPPPQALRPRAAEVEAGSPAPDLALAAPPAGPAPKGAASPDALVARALWAAERRDYRGAWEALDRALRRDPDHALGHLLAGVLAHLQGDLRRARQEYGEYLLREPTGARAGEVRKVLAAIPAGPGHGRRVRVAER